MSRPTLAQVNRRTVTKGMAWTAPVVAVVFMALAIAFGSAIYRRGLLQTGSVLSLRQALRLTNA